MFRNSLWAVMPIIIVVSLVVDVERAPAQGVCVTYRLVPQTVYDSQPATISRWVHETEYQTQQVTSYKPVYQTETRYRQNTVLKPVTKTSMREERFTVSRPYYETSYTEHQIAETTYEDVTEMREQRYLVRKPVVETQYREERVLVRKPVTQRMLKTENVTTFKPVQVTETEMVPSTVVTNQIAVDPNGGRSRLKWIERGCTVDPRTGQTVYQRPGFHWTREPSVNVQQVLMPTLIPQQRTTTRMVAETVQRQQPVDITTINEHIETRKVPVQVQRTEEYYEVYKIPVTVRKPVTKYRTEKRPVRNVKYRTEERVRRVPVTETTWERVTTDEPYQVQVCNWVAETREVKVPRTVSRRVDYQITQNVPRTVMMKVPVDQFGNVVGVPTPIASSAPAITLPIETVPADSSPAIGSSTVVGRAPLVDSTSGPMEVHYGKPMLLRRETLDGKTIEDDKPSSVLFPEKETEETSAKQPNTVLTPIKKAEAPEGSGKKRSGDDSADRVNEEGDVEPDGVDVEMRAVENDESNIKRRAADEPPSLNGPVTPAKND